MDYAQLLTISGGPQEISALIRQQKFDLIVSANDPSTTHEILPDDARAIPHYQSHVFSVGMIESLMNQGIGAINQHIVQAFFETSKLITAAWKREENVLVHCRQGFHRSSAIAIAAMMFMGADTAQAMRVIHQIRAPQYHEQRSGMDDVELFQNALDLKADAIEMYQRQHQVLAVADAMAQVLRAGRADTMDAATDYLLKSQMLGCIGRYLRDDFAAITDDLDGHIQRAKQDAITLTGQCLTELVAQKHSCKPA